MDRHLLENDLNYVFESISPLWEALRNQRIFLTGGTGFFGCWFLESFIWASKILNLNASLTILTRNPNNFKNKYPKLCQPDFIHFHQGDVRNFSFPDGNYAHIIHAATDITAFHSADAYNGIDSIIQGTARVLEFASLCNAQNMIYISSGAIYGQHPSTLTYFSENYLERPAAEMLKSAYGIGKYTAEHICHLYHHLHQVNVKIARCFTFIGPYMSLNAHFAVSHFMKAAILGTPLVIESPHPLYRSYQYAADLIVWLWKILLCGKPLQAYNVGSNEAISIMDVANLIAETRSPPLKIIQKKPWNKNVHAEYYVPDTSKTQKELNLIQKTSLAQAVNSTLSWYQNHE